MGTGKTVASERLAIWRENLAGERDGLALYRGLAALEADPERRKVFEHLAEGERRHAELWAGKLDAAGAGATGTPRPSAGVRTLLWLARRFGTNAVLPLVIQGEVGDAAKYNRQADARAVAVDEQEHQAALERLRAGPPPGASARIAERERWHRG